MRDGQLRQRIAPPPSPGLVAWLLPGCIALALAAGLFGGWQLWRTTAPSSSAAAARQIRLPFAAGPPWTMREGNAATPVATNCRLATPPATCQPSAAGAGALTFTRTDGATADETVLAPASGTIRWLNPAEGSLAIDLGDGYAVEVTTAALDPALTPGQTVRQGQSIGTTTAPTVARNAQTPRIQMTLWRIAGNQRLQPAAFSGPHALDGLALLDSVAAPKERVVVSSNEPANTTGPAAPALKGPATGLKVAASRARVTLTWNPVPGATAYRVEINGAAASPWLASPVWTTDSLKAGTYAWRVRAKNGSDTGPLSAPWSFAVGAPPSGTPAASPGLKASAPEAEVGATVHVTGAGFTHGEAVTLAWDGQALASVSAGANGAFATDLTLPEATGGRHAIVAKGDVSNRTVSTAITVRPSLARGPSSSAPGSRIAVAAHGFAANETVRLTWHAADGPALGTIATDARGSGTASITLPDGKPSWNDYTGTGEASRTQVWGAIEIQSSLTLSSAIAGPGTRINLSARGLPPGQPVAVAWNRTAGEAGTLLCRGNTDASGRFACPFIVPETGAGTYPVVLTGGDELSVASALTVRGKTAIAITPGATAVGTNVTLALGGFTPREAVALTLGDQPWRTVKVDANGALSLPATVPPRAQGDLTLTARGISSERTAAASFRVSATFNAGGGPAMIGTGTYRVTATREGLVGGTTSNGHVIAPNDRFVALPACLASNCPWLKPGKDDPIWGVRTECADRCAVKVINPANGTCAVAPVWDVGPWFRSDDWWRPANERRLNTKLGSPNTLAQGYPGTEAARDGLDVGYGVGPGGQGASDRYADVGNRAAIDLADGTWNDLGLNFERGIASGIEVQLLWQTGQDPASAAKGCTSAASTSRGWSSLAAPGSAASLAPAPLTMHRDATARQGKLAGTGPVAGVSTWLAGLVAAGTIRLEALMYTRIVIPLDGSAVAEQALGTAKEMASLTGAPLHLLGVVDPFDYQRASLTGMFIEPAMVAEALAEDERKARAYLEQVSEGLAPAVPTVEVDVVQGQPARAIVAYCQAGDLLVMASHGRGGLLRFFLGSVAESVVRQATVPVLLVHARQTGGE